MKPIDYLALFGLIVGGVYLVMALVARRRLRAREATAEPEGGRVILSIEDDSSLIEAEPTSDRMHKLAAICASVGRHAFGEDFDFSVESIALLDRAITAGWGEMGNTSVAADVLLSFGAYLGEVLVRRTRGRWVSGWTEEEPATVLFLGPKDETVNVSPFLLVREKFDNMYTFDLAIAFTALEQKLKELMAA
jgi:hypothetical protein